MSFNIEYCVCLCVHRKWRSIESDKDKHLWCKTVQLPWSNLFHWLSQEIWKESLKYMQWSKWFYMWLAMLSVWPSSLIMSLTMLIYVSTMVDDWLRKIKWLFHNYIYFSFIFYFFLKSMIIIYSIDNLFEYLEKMEIK